jgi:hypothetical protein
VVAAPVFVAVACYVGGEGAATGGGVGVAVPFCVVVFLVVAVGGVLGSGSVGEEKRRSMEKTGCWNKTIGGRRCGRVEMSTSVASLIMLDVCIIPALFCNSILSKKKIYRDRHETKGESPKKNTHNINIRRSFRLRQNIFHLLLSK